MRERLDMRLTTLGLAESRAKAQRLILAGAVRVNGRPAQKPGLVVKDTDLITVQAAEKYVSRGGYKLEAALDAFAINCNGAVCVDIGSSTGGFTDCLLQHGAKRVHAVDVGRGQLSWQLRNDPRVVLHERLNARHMSPDDIGEAADIVTVDVSFISLTKILPAAVRVLKPGGTVVALIKPQFEAGKKHVKKGGVVRDSSVHQKVKDTIAQFAVAALGLAPLGPIIESPLPGPAGNKEFLAAWRRP
ncbi:MAG: TlyA family RNA methyltransferase [Verrucomicrobiae bacterium]|nr:TlyA family RNA methyltransferase [Verrucomicrobiae bacterium]